MPIKSASTSTPTVRWEKNVKTISMELERRPAVPIQQSPRRKRRARLLFWTRANAFRREIAFSPGAVILKGILASRPAVAGVLSLRRKPEGLDGPREFESTQYGTQAKRPSFRTGALGRARNRSARPAF